MLDTGVPFLDHMLDQIKRHGLVIWMSNVGDTHIDDHHSVEDVGIAIGQALKQAQATKGIRRYGHFYAPLDESLSRVVVDISGRPGLHMNVPFTRSHIGSMDVDLFSEFFMGWLIMPLSPLHIDTLKGKIAITKLKAYLKP